MKKEERFYLDRFLKNFPELKLSNIQNHECPDFLCVCGGKTIGLEVTKFFHKQNEDNTSQVRHSYRSRFSREIIEEHIKRNLPAIHVSVHMDSDDILLNKEGRECVIDLLLNYVSQPFILGKQQYFVDFQYTDSLRSDFGIAGLSIVQSETLTKPFWGVPHAEFLPDTTPKVIQEIISEKNSKIEGYKMDVDEHWLLIIAGTGGLNSTVHLDKNSQMEVYNSKFDRVFLFSLFGPFVCEFKLA